ncbi:DUF1592 domain-containing protein [Thalassoroseus pseudoceratinae]|uniref:DUF1592 domain-containing protein n=1 Tax=Thalassoroseus pseudoceratinae TaxID=2713176 RepID=UPI001421F074|nr:DUF1592 domain-containing protein [Thalassoroseus pseudoceratinae]
MANDAERERNCELSIECSLRSVFGWLIVVLPLLLASSTRAAESETPSKFVVSALRTHCVECHGDGEDAESDVALQSVEADELATDLDLLGRLVRVLDLGEMPPDYGPTLKPELRQQLIAELRRMREAALSKQSRRPHAPIRRMNRFQYNNAVVDLFDLDRDVFSLPERMMRDHGGYFQPATGTMAEVVTVGSRPLGKSQMIEPRLGGIAAFPQDLRAEHGFDNQGDHLSLSPLLMDAFLKLGLSIPESPDFGPRTVGIWKPFFESSAAGVDHDVELRRRLEPFLRRAFRQPIDSEQLDRYIAYANHQLDDGVPFTDVMKSLAAATLASPKFLYLYDRSTETDAAETLGDFELASRLSFFLWGSLPDATLLELASKGRLSDTPILNEQVERMLRDRKLKRFCDSFPSQWLQLERIISSVPDREQFPRFYFSKYRASMHMMLEPLLLFETVLVENRPITELIDPDFTYRSEYLNSVYGELASTPVQNRGPEVAVARFRRMPVTDRRSGGVITNAAVMTMTSGPDRTQPITRGAWVASVIFNNPPKPPPADVPPLEENPPADEQHLTLRERLALHRQRRDCKGCHEKIDPLGFALENYNPIGKWRDQYHNKRAIDPSGTLFRRHEFHDVVEFKDAILVEKDRFTRAFAGHLLSFALARELEAADQSALDHIVQATAADDYKIQTLIKQVIFSEPFRNKSNPRILATSKLQPE